MLPRKFGEYDEYNYKSFYEKDPLCMQKVLVKYIEGLFSSKHISKMELGDIILFKLKSCAEAMVFSGIYVGANMILTVTRESGGCILHTSEKEVVLTKVLYLSKKTKERLCQH